VREQNQKKANKGIRSWGKFEGVGKSGRLSNDRRDHVRR